LPCTRLHDRYVTPPCPERKGAKNREIETTAIIGLRVRSYLLNFFVSIAIHTICF
jgi:hypothetical protein